MKNKKILEYLIYLVIFFIPLYLLRIKIGIFPTNILEIIIAVIFIIWLFSDREKINFKRIFLKYKKYIISIGFIMTGLLISIFLSGNRLESWGIIKGWFLLPMVLIFLAGKIIEKEKINQVFLVYLFSATTVAAVALIYLFLGITTFDGRLEAFFNSPNYLAMYLAPALIIALEQIRNINLKKQNSNAKLKNLILLLLAIILVAFYFTYSYAAWIAVAVSMGVIFIFKNKTDKKGYKKIINAKVLAIIGIIFLLFFAQLKNEKFNNLIKLDSRSSLSSRVIIWKASVKMIKDNFLFGIGPGNFQDKYLDYQKFYPPYLEWAVPHPHNIFLSFWLYGGIFGLVGFVGLVFFFFRDILKKEPHTVLFMALGIMLVILIQGIFDTTYFKNDLAIIFWLNFLALKV